MTQNQFIPLQEIMPELDEKQQERLRRVTEDIENTEFVNATISRETGDLRFVDENGELLMEKEGFL